MKQVRIEEKWYRLAELAPYARSDRLDLSKKSEWQTLAHDCGVRLLQDAGMHDVVGIIMPGNPVTFGEVQILSKFPVKDSRSGDIVTSNWTLSLFFDSPDVSETRWYYAGSLETNANAIARVASGPAIASTRYLDIAYRYENEVSYLSAMAHRRLQEVATCRGCFADWRNIYVGKYI